MVYTPTQRYLSYNVGKAGCIFGKYAFVISKDNKDNYTSIELEDPFAGIVVDYENKRIDLGPNYSRYLYAYGPRKDAPLGGMIYAPSQRYLEDNVQTEITEELNGHPVFNGI